jgi:hypothetical protein
MKTASVVAAGLEQHPHSAKQRMCIMVSLPWASAGVSYPATEIWGEATMPKPAYGETVRWDHSHIWYRDVRYDKPELDSNPDPSLPST